MWFTTVAFGGNPAPRGPWRSDSEAANSIRRWLHREGADAGTLVAAHTIRVHTYRTRAAARQGDISDGRQCLGRYGLWDFLAHVTPHQL